MEKLESGEWRLGPDGKVQSRKRFGEWGPVSKATAGWDDNAGVTRVQRRKEEASDYRYFPEPDLVPVRVDEEWLNRVRAMLGELPAVQRARLKSQYGLSEYDAGVLTRQGRKIVAYFEELAAVTGDSKTSANWVINAVIGASATGWAITVADLAGLIAEQKSLGLTKQVAEQVFETMRAGGIDAKAAIAKLGIKKVDEGQLAEIIKQAIADNPKSVEDYRKGKTAAMQRIKGAVMKATKGTAKPDLVDKLLAEELAKEQ